MSTNTPATSTRAAAADQFTYARARLWLGIACVGSHVIISSAALLFALPQRLLPAEATTTAQNLGATLLFFGTVALAMLPFDILGGWFLPQRFSRGDMPFGGFMLSLLRGIIVQVLFFTILFLVYLQIGTEIGVTAVIAIFVVTQSLLTALQLPLARWVAGLRSNSLPDDLGRAIALDGKDAGFTGGIAGFPPNATIVIPSRWFDVLPDHLLRTAVLRRTSAMTSGKRFAGLTGAIVWNTICFAIAISMPGGGTASVANLATSYFYFALLSFVGLLILPKWNRRAVIAVDNLAAQSTSASEVTELAERLEELADGEPARTATLESVFHPVPCVDRRAVALASPTSPRGMFWNVARTALFLSWAFGGPLARSVHCNIGRPELWVLLPTD